jgi:hypothetical protein
MRKIIGSLRKYHHQIQSLTEYIVIRVVAAETHIRHESSSDEPADA